MCTKTVNSHNLKRRLPSMSLDVVWYWFDVNRRGETLLCSGGYLGSNAGVLLFRRVPDDISRYRTYRSSRWSTVPVKRRAGVKGGAGVATRLTLLGSGGDKSQFTQGAVALDDIFTGCLYSSFDNAATTSFISLKDESKAENVISSLRQRRHWLRIKEEGGAS